MRGIRQVCSDVLTIPICFESNTTASSLHVRLRTRPAGLTIAAMRRLGAPLAIAALALVAALPPTASAAATRAEYLAQIEPICQQANEQAKRQARKINRALKKSLKKAGTQEKNDKPGLVFADVFILAVIKLVGPENRLFERTTAQIAAIPPAPGDEVVVNAWLTGRVQSAELAWDALRAGKRRKPNRMFALLDASTEALRKGQQPVQAFGLNHCFIELPVV